MQTIENNTIGLQIPMFSDSIAQRFSDFNKENPNCSINCSKGLPNN